LVKVCGRRFQRCALSKKNLTSAVALVFGAENGSALIKALETEAGVEVNAGCAN
jgi:hypothetical protein